MKTFVRLMTGCALLAIAKTPPCMAAGPTPSTIDESSVDLRSFGLAFHAPDGWLREPEMSFSQLARFAKLADGKLSGLMEVQAAPSKGRSAKAVAATLASNLGGSVADKRTIGSEPAGTVEISLPHLRDFAVARAAVVPVHEQFVIVQMGANSQADLEAAFKTVMGTMAAKPPTPAADDLGVDRKRSVALFDSSVLVPFPEPFRPDKVKDPAKQMFLGVHDWASGHDDASVQVQLLPNPAHKAVKEVADGMADRLSAKMGVAITFTKVNDDPEAYISNPFPPTGKDVQRVVQVRIDDDRIAVLIFRSTAADPNVRTKYMDAAEQIAKAARTSAAYEAARRAAGVAQPK